MPRCVCFTAYRLTRKLLLPRRFYSKGSTCCDDIRLQMNCDPVGPCREFAGDCTDIPEQFTTMLFVDPLAECQPLPSPVTEYVCSAFPDDENPIDSFLVGLISLAVALPVTLFLESSFSLSNTVMSPDLWLDWPGVWWLIFIGKEANKNWHYMLDGELPSRVARWYARFYSQGEPTIVTIRNIFIRIKCWLLRQPCPWEEAPEDETEAGDDPYELARAGDLPDSPRMSTPRMSSMRLALGGRRSVRLSLSAGYQDGLLSPETEAEKEAREEAQGDVLIKRVLLSAGIIGTGITWVLFAWFTFTYGLLIYNTLGAKAQDSFVNRYAARQYMARRHCGRARARRCALLRLCCHRLLALSHALSFPSPPLQLGRFLRHGPGDAVAGHL